MDYLIYHLRPYGIIEYAQPLPKKLSFSDITAENVTDGATNKQR